LVRVSDKTRIQAGEEVGVLMTISDFYALGLKMFLLPVVCSALAITSREHILFLRRDEVGHLEVKAGDVLIRAGSAGGLKIKKRSS